MNSPVLRKYRTRFYYLRLVLGALLVSVFVVVYWNKPEFSGSAPLTLALFAILGGVALWVLIVSFPYPFSTEALAERKSMRDLLLQERIKTVMLILAVSATLFLLHTRNQPPYPKTGMTFLVIGFTWANYIMWPEIKRIWREDAQRRKEKKGWRIGL